MFIRPFYRCKNGKRHAYWALVESHRTPSGPRQRIVGYLGALPEGVRKGVKSALQGRSASAQASLFPESDGEAEHVEVDSKRVRVENPRAFGGAWLAMELIRALGLDGFIASVLPRGGETVPWHLTALILAICRLLNPSPGLRDDSCRASADTPSAPENEPARTMGKMQRECKFVVKAFKALALKINELHVRLANLG